MTRLVFVLMLAACSNGETVAEDADAAVLPGSEAGMPSTLDLSLPPRPAACQAASNVTHGPPNLPASTRAPVPPYRTLIFQVLSDVHIHRSDLRSVTNLNAALDDLHAVGPSSSALVIVGDLTEHGLSDDYNLLAQTMGGKPHPQVFYTMGNHEYHGGDSSAVELQRYLSFAAVPHVWYERNVNGYPFLILGGENGDGDLPKLAWTAMLSNAQLDWLEERLTALASDSQPSFVFMHQPPWNSNAEARLNQILSRHPNVVLFWAHWHRDLHTGTPGTLMYNSNNGYLQVHTGGTQYLWQGQSLNYNWKQGVQVEVRGDKIQIRGRDFNTGTWINEFNYTLPREDNPDANGVTRDFDGDGQPDTLGQWLDGKLTAYLPNGQFNIATAFDGLSQLLLADADADGKADVLGISPDGKLMVYRNTSTPGAPSLAAPVELGTGWNGARRVTVIDFDRDGKQDLVATGWDGKMTAFFNCGTPGTPSYCCSLELDAGHGNDQRMRALDIDNDGNTDLITQTADGKLVALLNGGDSTAPGFSARKELASGFDQVTRLSVVDADQDGRGDLIARAKDGNLFAWLNDGAPGMPALAMPANIGTGWQSITRVVVSGNDLLGRWPDGKLTRYLNTGTPGKPAFTLGGDAGTGWQLISRVLVQ